jgi:hypothetical protein
MSPPVPYRLLRIPLVEVIESFHPFLGKMRWTFFISLALTGLPVLRAGSPPGKRETVEECLATAGVPYNARGSRAWSQDVAPFNLRLPFKPVAIAVPTTIGHIQGAVACTAKLGLKASPKGGGHSYASLGLGGQDGHLVIELDRMSAVRLKDDNTATVQGGARLGHVATELYAQGKRAISHGTCPGCVLRLQSENSC